MKLDYNTSLSYKTIAVDFDDTLSLTTVRDWENAEPNWQIINKINNLYDKGWQILIITARGQLSCDGDTDAADKKYRKLIETWLSKYHVKYHKLSFNKYLAAMYLDDKSITPEDFMELEIKEIKTGWSGAKVEKRGDRIYKTHHDSFSVAEWYKMASPLVNTPIVHSLVGKTLCLEYLVDNGHYFKIDEVNSAIEKFSLYKTNVKFETYIDRMQVHVDYNKMFDEIITMLSKQYIVDYCNDRCTFMHGDMSIENLIQTDNGLFFIDPIYKKDSWSSYLLDITKMLHSYRKYNRMFEYEVFLNGWIKSGEDALILKLLEITQWIRVIKYIPDKNIKNEYIEITKNLISKFKQEFV